MISRPTRPIFKTGGRDSLQVVEMAIILLALGFTAHYILT